jgi:hypothetical protein
VHRSFVPTFARFFRYPDGDSAAADAAAAATAASDKAAADKAAADKATADAAAADAAKAASDKAAADAAAAAKASQPPEKYDLKLPDTQLPDGSPLDPAIVERTAAIARELGLSNEAGQKLLDKVVAETVATMAARSAAVNAAWEPEKGAEWKKQNAAWQEAALKDPEVGGSPAKLAQSVEFAQRALKQFFPPETADFLKAYGGLGSNPAVLKGLAKIGRAMGEGGVVLGQTGVTNDGKSKEERRAEKLFPNTNKPAAASA